MSCEPPPWRYVVVAACASCLFFGPSLQFSHGVLLVALEATGRYELSSVTWLISFNTMMHALGGPIGSVLVNLTSCRTTLVLGGLLGFVGVAVSSCVTNITLLFITYGVITGIARGMVFSSAVVTLGYWFKADSSIATGITMSGGGLGMLVHPRLLQALVDVFDADGALLLMGAISFHVCIAGLLLRPSEFERQKWRDKKHAKTNDENILQRYKRIVINFRKKILTNFSFIFFILSALFMMIGFQIIIVFMPDYMNSQGSTPQQSAMAASITGVGSMVSRVLFGVMANDEQIGSILVLAGTTGLAAMFTLLLPLFVDSEVGRYLYAYAIGTYFSSIPVLFGPTTLQKVGIEDFADGFGFLLLNIGIICLVSPPLGVQVKELTNSYHAVFLFAGGMMLASSACVLVSELLKSSRTEDENNPSAKSLLPRTLTIEDEPRGDIPEEIASICEDECREKLDKNIETNV